MKITKLNKNIYGDIKICGSKSESNRFLILKYLYKDVIKIKNLSNSEDTKILKHIIQNNIKNSVYNVNNAGTTIRFLTAFFSIKKNQTTILTGSERMKKRPISILVDALNNLGAKIEYTEKPGYPPIKITGNNIQGGKIIINSEISSQYISALMLIAPKLKFGLKIILHGNTTSRPYIIMTTNILKKLGISVNISKNTIEILNQQKIHSQTIHIESDWSSVSYFYSIAAISNKCFLKIQQYKYNSNQGDIDIKNIYKKFFGVKTIFKKNEIILLKQKFKKRKKIFLNLNNTPDIAQTIIITCAILKIKCTLKGLNTLKIKETDRIQALKIELNKIGVETKITDDSIKILNFFKNTKTNIMINTYNDHRMAMAFTPLSMIYPIKIENPNVINKSYPNFWNDLKKLNFIISKS